MDGRLRSAIQHRRRVVLGWTLIALGGFAVLLGWLGVSSEQVDALQLPYLASGAVGGLLLAGVGSTLLLSGDLREDFEAFARVEGHVLDIRDCVQELHDELREVQAALGVVRPEVVREEVNAERSRSTG